MPIRLLTLLTFALAACTHGPEIREGPPLTARFGPPPGGAHVERWSQVRDVVVEFPEDEDRRVVERLEGSTLEKYEPMPQGGWRVVAVVREERTTRDGETMNSPLPLVGVPFVHAIDGSGRFVTALEIDETLRVIRERVHDDGLQRLLETVLTPEAIAARARRSWQHRFAGLCGRELERGATLWSVEEQELPIGGGARVVVERTVVGDAEINGRRVMELQVRYGGGRSSLASKTGAFDVLQPFGGRDALTPRVEGRGVRFVDLDTCQTVREEATIRGEFELNRDAAKKTGWTGFPEHVRFEVTRSLQRSRAEGA